MIYDKQINEDKYYNQDIYYKDIDKDKVYTYDLEVVKETSYKSIEIDLKLESYCREKCVDIQMDKVKYARIFGMVKDCEGKVVKNKKITILRSELINYKTQYIPVCNLITDEKGLYEVIIEDYSEENYYRAKIIDEN